MVIEIPLIQLKPQWIEFTSTKGVLRVLQPKDLVDRIQGLIFICPRCRSNKQKAHYCVFLFDQANVDATSRPHGRFWPSRDSNTHPARFEKLSLWQIQDDVADPHLRPGDMKCRWEGELQDGVVRWEPSLIERLWK